MTEERITWGNKWNNHYG